ncbi:MAG: malate synthase A, partial [Plesiomonas sp.]
MNGYSDTLTHPILTCSEHLTREYASILTPDAVEFLAQLVTRFAPQVTQLLAEREVRQADIDAGGLPDFLPNTQNIRESEWQIRGVPADLQDRRVEITGPVERKMIINALNANVKVFMADFEDSLAPSWEKVMQGQLNLRDAVDGTIEHRGENGKNYRLNAKHAVLICRVRGFHLQEKHIQYQHAPIPGNLFDFALYFHHNYQRLLAKG